MISFVWFSQPLAIQVALKTNYYLVFFPICRRHPAFESFKCNKPPSCICLLDQLPNIAFLKRQQISLTWIVVHYGDHWILSFLENWNEIQWMKVSCKRDARTCEDRENVELTYDVPVGDLGALLLGTGTGFLTDGGWVNFCKTFNGSMFSLTVHSSTLVVLLAPGFSGRDWCSNSGHSRSEGTNPSLKGGLIVATFQKQPSGRTVITWTTSPSRRENPLFPQ